MPKLRAIAVALFAAAALPAAAAPSQPIVVELFTSQGCSSCPPANEAVGKLADRPGVIALSFGVTYWDYLGWKDTFARADYTERQRAYAKALGRSGPYTPQVVVNGAADTVGNTAAKIDKLIVARRAPAATDIALSPGLVRVGAGKAPTGGADVWLVSYDPRIVQIPVKRGENTGKTLPHRNVVRDLRRLGRWTGSEAAFKAPSSASGLRTVVLVQAPNGGAILAAKAAG
ncbi:DUF1223 domain-containing protein [Phenylobacterium sp.]|uniref:DUF1223 domain-containing protein n=1 Tax=Phenylobacterium sp. TaxID=1871053 RepID=UPI00286A3AC5|nr:DUF1223 domain-containing protein [Phenylobacterium sp.]